MQCAAVRMRSPAAESSTDPLQTCSDCPPRKTAPTRESRPTVPVAVTDEVVVAGAACWVDAEWPQDTASTTTAAARTIEVRRMVIDLARTSWRTARRGVEWRTGGPRSNGTHWQLSQCAPH